MNLIYVFETGKIKLDNKILCITMDEHSNIYEVADDNSIAFFNFKFINIKDII